MYIARQLNLYKRLQALVISLLQCYGVSRQLCLYHIQQVIVQIFEIFCYKLCCATFTRSKAVHQVMIASHTLHGITQSIHLCKVMILQLISTTVPFFDGYPFHQFMQLGRTSSTIASYLVHYTIYPYTIYRRVSNSLVDLQHLLCPFYKVMGCYINYDSSQYNTERNLPILEHSQQ